MTVFSREKTKVVNPIFRLPVDTSTGVTGLLRSEFAREQASLLYPKVSGTSQEEVDQFLSAGLVGPLQARAEGITQQKKVDVYNEVIEVTALDQKTPEQALDELESLREDNPFLKAYVSPAVLAALKQSDNPTARRAAQGKLANVLIATEVINNKMSEANTGFINGVGDFFDVLASDLPIVSAFNVERRKELSDRFRQLLDSNEDASIVKAEMESLIAEAADMGFFTDANRFYLNDFLGLTLEGGKGAELAMQQGFAALDILLATGALADTGKLVALTRGSTKESAEVLMKGVTADNIAGAIDPATWKESLSTVGRVGPRSPEESTAAQLVEIELKARQEAISVRLAAGSSIDDETFEIFAKTEVAKAQQRAEKAGNLRYIDADLQKDAFDNVTMSEYYGTTKGKAFTSQKAAQLYADQILGEVVPVVGQENKWMVKKTSNVKTGIYSQGATPNDIINDLGLYKSLDTDELGSGFFAHLGSPLSQTDWTNNAVLKQGEFARAKALDTIEVDIGRQLKIVGPEGKSAVERVYTEMRDGSLAHLRSAPTIAEFDDYFFKINGRRATEQELKLHQLKLEWNDTDWYLSADAHFKRAVERGIEILIPQDGIEVGAVKTNKAANAGRQVWDADAGAYVAVDALAEDRIIFKLVEPMEFGGKLHDLVATATPKVRALKHTDVMGYNVGGSRLYAPNRTNFMVKQSTEYDLADGTKRQGNPRTLMAVKTEKEARKATEEINTVLKGLHAVVDPKAFSRADDYLSVIRTKYKDADLNDLVARNSAWNTDVHSIANLVEFAAENNFDLRKLVDFVSDGQPLVKGDDMVGDITFKDVAIAPGPLKYGDFRKDSVLMGYGGQKVPTIAPFEAISRSLMSSVAKQTETAYETRAIMRLYRTALEKNLLPRENIALIRNMSLRQKARNMVIATGTQDGKKLELERKKILSRLEKQRMFDNHYHKAKDALANALWDKGWKKASEKIDALSSDPVAGTRGIVFDAYLGLGAIDQFYVQASQMINVIAMSDKALGMQAAAIAPYFRKTLMNGHKGPTEVMAKLSSGLLGISPEQFTAMIDTFKTSGRGFVNASVADLGEDSAGMVMFNKVRQVGRLPYTEGELMARTTAHIAASLEYLKKFGKDANLGSQHAMRWVTNQTDVFTNAMSSTSRHWLEQLPMMQFMSYTMRMAEWYMGGLTKDLGNLAKGGSWNAKFGVLSFKQKFRLFTTQLAMYGAAAVPGLGYAIDKYNREYGTSLTEPDFYQIRYGLIDNLIRYASGVETELGRRLAWGEGLFQTITDLQDKPIGQAVLGPAGTFGGTVLDAVTKMMNNLKYAGTDMLAEDTLDVFRSIKSVNMAYNAWMAFRYDIIRSRKGDMLIDDVSTGEAIATALGVPLHRVNELWRQAEFGRKDQEWYKARARTVSALYEDWFFERQTNGIGGKRERQIVAAIETFNMVHKEYMQDINRYVNKKFITMDEELTIELMEKEAKRKVAE